VLGFAFLLALGLLRHEMWRDELQAWMLARASPTLPALLSNLRYEGHPALWHLLLFPLARGGAGPGAMQAVHFLLAALGATLFLAWAPLPLPLRALFVCGYLPLFEYGVISRNYALALPLLWLCCRLATAVPRRLLPLGLALGVLANANPYAWLLAAALLASLAVDSVATPASRRALAARPFAAAGGAAVAVVGLGLALWQMLPPPDAAYADRFLVWWAPRLWRVLGAALAAYLPFPDWRTATPWNSALLFRLPPLPLAALATLGLGAAFVLLGSRLARTWFALGTAALLAFGYVEYLGFARHHGHQFVLLVACCWLAGAAPAEPPWRSRLRVRALAALLLVHLATAAWLYGVDLVAPFSGARAAARRLAAPPLATLAATAYPDPVLPALGAYRGAPLLSLARGEPLAFVRWREGADPRLSPGEVCAHLLGVAHAQGGAVALVAPPATLPARGCPGLLSERLATAPAALVPSERLAVWRIAEAEGSF
jgi:hypothetical protein